MKLSVLGSCTVIEYPQQLNIFFNKNNLVDVRNGKRMEMDAFPLLCLAISTENKTLIQRILIGLEQNLLDSNNQIWRCGCWGFNEVHLRFTSVALRTLLLAEIKNINLPAMKNKAITLLDNHLVYRDELSSGVWFLHDSLESDKHNYYPTWNGSEFLGASYSNRLILNTHLDTLITLIMFKHHKKTQDLHHKLIEDALDTLLEYITKADVITGFRSYIDRIFRNILARTSQVDSIIPKIGTALIERIYYQKLRFNYKKRNNILGFSDGFIERDIRLSGQELEYHVVNIWDMSKLLLWMDIENIQKERLKKNLINLCMKGLKYCLVSTSYSAYIKRISAKKGVNNEVLEAIAIMFSLNQATLWLIELYFTYRKFSPRSIGILGIDQSISIPIKQSTFTNEHLDIIHFKNQSIFIANAGKTPQFIPKQFEHLNFQSVPNSNVIKSKEIPPYSIYYSYGSV